MERYFDTALNNKGEPAVGLTVTVTDSNGAMATLYSDNGVTQTDNPFYTDRNGAFFFYAANGRYTVTLTADGVAPASIKDAILNDPADGYYGDTQLAAGLSATLGNTTNGKGADLVANAAKKVASIAALRALRVPQGSDAQTVIVDGYASANDGGGGVFQWWPNSSTADDSGIYINPTGNAGNGRWVRADFSIFGPIHAEWYGAIPGGTGDLSSNVANATTYLGNNGTLVFGPGTFLFNVDLGGRKINIRGAGYDKTILQPYANTSAAVTFGGNAAFEWLEVSDLTLSGGASIVAGSVAVSFGHPTYQTNDEYAGRVRFIRVKFNNFDKFVYKRYGNIGNRYDDCMFANANYHTYAVGNSGTTGSLMHAGCDVYSRCHFAAAQLACFYVDSPENGSGQFIHNACIYENNPGFILFVNNFSYTWSPGIVFNDPWFENNATATSVTINGTSYTPQDLHLTNIPNIVINRGRPNKVTLTNSILTLVGCNTDGLQVTKDTASAVVAREIIGDSSTSTSFYASDILYQRRPASNYGSGFFSKPRMRLTHGYTPLIAKSFNEGPESFAGSVAATANQVADGVLFDSCVELSISSGQNEVIAGITPTTNKYTVVTVDVKLMSGNPVSVGFTYNMTLLSGISVSDTTWRSFVGITNTQGVTTNSIGLYLSGPSSGTSVIRLSAYQIVEFDDLQEAIKFVDSGLYAAPATLPRTVYGTAAPTTGAWNVGDECINRSPAVGSPKSWKCTAAGSPGTWTSTGNL